MQAAAGLTRHGSNVLTNVRSDAEGDAYTDRPCGIRVQVLCADDGQHAKRALLSLRRSHLSDSINQTVFNSERNSPVVSLPSRPESWEALTASPAPFDSVQSFLDNLERLPSGGVRSKVQGSTDTSTATFLWVALALRSTHDSRTSCK